MTDADVKTATDALAVAGLEHGDESLSRLAETGTLDDLAAASLESHSERIRELGAKLIGATASLAIDEVEMLERGGVPVAVGPELSSETQTKLRNLLAAALSREENPEALIALIAATPAVADGSLVPLVASYATSELARVREAVAWALGGLAGTVPDDLVVEHLVRLARDDDERVRDVATFELGAGHGMPIDRPETREVFRTNSKDLDPDVQKEAIDALALLGDVAMLQKALTTDDVDADLVEAAKRTADPRLCEVLKRLAESGWAESESRSDPAYGHTLLAQAIAACCATTSASDVRPVSDG